MEPATAPASATANQAGPAPTVTRPPAAQIARMETVSHQTHARAPLDGHRPLLVAPALSQSLSPHVYMVTPAVYQMAVLAPRAGV